MEKEKLARRASQLKISSISLAENLQNGNFKSIYHGQGIEFSDVRDYLPGDNVRAIDWNVTARMGRPFIKQYEEDKELSVFLILDDSASMTSGSKGKSKISVATETAALLILAAEKSAGSTGAVFFDGDIKFSCHPKSGREHAMMILSKLDRLSAPANEDGIPEYTDIIGSVLGNAIKGAAKILRKRSLVFILSDFRAANWEKPFAQLAQKNDVIAIRLIDSTDSELPEIGTVPFYDNETGKASVFPTSSRKFKMAWFENNRNRVDQWRDYCTANGAFPITLSTAEDPVIVLSKFFSQRSRK